MIPVARSNDVTIYSPRDGRFAFFNSPYPAHKVNSGIDVYSGQGFNEIISSPVNGKITMIRRIKAPRGRGFKDSGYDVITLIKSSENHNMIVKTLHVDPVIDVGTSVEVGDDLGRLLRSGYFGWGTSPHIHLEVRNPLDPIRARGGLLFKNLVHTKNNLLTSIEGQVIDVVREYALITLDYQGNGLTCLIDDSIGILDGGIPYYGWMGIHMNKPVAGTVKLIGKDIAHVVNIGEGYVLADCFDFNFNLDDQLLFGLSLYLTPINTPIVKILPLYGRELGLKIGDFVKVEIANKKFSTYV
jgi:hypothetical protein